MGDLINKITSIFRWLGVGFFTLLLWIPCTICGLLDGKGRLAHLHHRLWARLILFATGAQIQIFGLQNIEKGKKYVIASNHEGNGDIPLLIWSLPLQFKFAAKRVLFRIPIFGWAMWWARYVAIDRNSGAERAKEAMEKLRDKLDQGFSVLMFPEGTRTRDGNIGAFKSGTFRLALQANVEILPVAIFGSFRGQSANDWVMNPCPVILNIGKPLPAPVRPAHKSVEEQVHDFKRLCRNEILRLHDEAKSIDHSFQGLSPSEVEAA